MFERPKNAYEGCLMAADMIENNPYNYVQQVYRARAGESWVDGELKEVLERETNICHTAYCRAGWVCLLVQGKYDPASDTLSLADRGVQWEPLTMYLLGVRPDEAFNWDSDFLEDISHMTSPNSNRSEADLGTVEYAREGARGLREFAAKWRNRLEATTYPQPATYAEWASARDKVYKEACGRS